MEFQDRTLNCAGCQQDFIFSAGEQAFYQNKGFTQIPKRCKPCRDKRKNAAAGESAAAGATAGEMLAPAAAAPAAAPAAGEMPGGRPLYDAVCTACNASTRVPFRPAAGRPVYCRPCHQMRVL